MVPGWRMSFTTSISQSHRRTVSGDGREAGKRYGAGAESCPSALSASCDEAVLVPCRTVQAPARTHNSHRAPPSADPAAPTGRKFLFLLPGQLTGSAGYLSAYIVQ